MSEESAEQKLARSIGRQFEEWAKEVIAWEVAKFIGRADIDRKDAFFRSGLAVAAQCERMAERVRMHMHEYAEEALKRQEPTA